MGFPIKLVEENSLKATEDGFEVKCRLLWYRSLPLSCVEQVSIAVDGMAVEQAAIHIGLNDSMFRLDELEDLVDQIWFVQDSARLIVKKAGLVSKGGKYQVEVGIVLRAPYIMVGPDKFLTMPGKHAVIQVAT